jgi:hypothetical protein
MKEFSNDYFDCNSYLNQFWPQEIENNEIWKDNEFLLNQYVKCQKIINHLSSEKRNNLDISSGPILAPTIAFSTCIKEIQLTDYSHTNREILAKMDINYWFNYCGKILEIENNEKPSKKEVLERFIDVDKLRKKNIPKYINLLEESIFNDFIDIKKWNMFTMHFVTDSIVDSKNEYFQIMNKFIKIIKKDDVIVISALTECDSWSDGISNYKSANISLDEIVNFFTKNKFEILHKGERKTDSEAGHNGGMAVICGIKK